MEITETTLIVKWLCQLFGFAPYKIIRNQSNQIVGYKRSYALCFYSLALITVFGVSSNIALYYDFHSGHALRMKTVTLGIVYWFDVNTVSVSGVINIIVSMFALKNVRRVNLLLRKIDKDLGIFEPKNCLHSEKEKRKIKLSVIGCFLLLTTMLASDFSAWVCLASKYQTNDEISGHTGHNFLMNVYLLLPFYCMYIAFVPLHAKFAVTIYRIALRYRLLNESIRKYSAAVKRYGYFPSDRNRAEDVVHRFMSIYDALGTVLRCESSEFGATVIVLIVSCLFHMILTLYSIFTEILITDQSYFVVLHWLWVGFHMARTICIIEPCHMVSVEAKNTMTCVCDLMETKHDIYVLNHFWKKLNAEQVHFNACGICRIDRGMLTTIAASLVTYLVILIQFQR